MYWALPRERIATAVGFAEELGGAVGVAIDIGDGRKR